MKFKLRVQISLALLTALSIILTRFLSFSVWNMRIGLGFVPVALAGMLYGPVASCIVAVLADVLGAILFPSGTFFVGFTVTAAISGGIYGLILRKDQRILKILLTVLLNQIICTLLLNTFWISLLYGSPYLQLLITRLVQSAVMAPVQFIVLWLLARFLPQISRYTQEKLKKTD